MQRDFSKYPVEKLSSLFNITVSNANTAVKNKVESERAAVNLVDYVGERASIKMLLALQDFAAQVGEIEDMTDLSFLQGLQNDNADLIPPRFQNSVDKYLRSRGDYGVLPFSTGAEANGFVLVLRVLKLLTPGILIRCSRVSAMLILKNLVSIVCIRVLVRV